MDFELNEEHRMLKDLVRRFVAEDPALPDLDAAAAHPPLVAAARPAMPYGHDHDATPWWHTTRQESLPSRPCPAPL